MLIAGPLALAIAASLPSTPLLGTPPETWSSAGFKQFRWGMGSADVEAAVRRGGTQPRMGSGLELDSDFDVHGFGRAFLANPGLVLADTPTRIVFRFLDNRLYALEVLPTADRECMGWVLDMRKALTIKYGKPSSCSEPWDGLAVLCEWSRPGVTIVLSGTRGLCPKTLAAVSYSSRAMKQEVDARLRKMVEDSAKEQKKQEEQRVIEETNRRRADADKL
jgi:hypothetical protein